MLDCENLPQEDSPEELKFPAVEPRQGKQQPSLRQRYSAMLAAASAPQQQLPDSSCSSSNTHLGSPLSHAGQLGSPAVLSKDTASSMAAVESAVPVSMERSAAATASNTNADNNTFPERPPSSISGAPAAEARRAAEQAHGLRRQSCWRSRGSSRSASSACTRRSSSCR